MFLSLHTKVKHCRNKCQRLCNILMKIEYILLWYICVYVSMCTCKDHFLLKRNFYTFTDNQAGKKKIRVCAKIKLVVVVELYRHQILLYVWKILKIWNLTTRLYFLKDISICYHIRITDFIIPVIFTEHLKQELICPDIEIKGSEE